MPIRIYDDSSSEFVYSGSWLRTGTWSSNDGQRGTASSTSEEGASVSFAFPVPATAFRFYGLKSSRGAYYAVCVDCNPSSPQWTFVSAYNATDNGTSPPVYFYHYSWPTPGLHRVTIVNQSDRRGIPSGNSVLTLDRFELDVPVTLPTTASASQAPSSIASSTVVQPQTTVDAGNGGGSSSAPVTTQVTSQGGVPTTLVVTQNVTASSGASTPAAGGAAASITTPASASAPNLQSQTASSAPSDKPLDVNSNNNLGSSSKSTPLGGIVGGVVGGLAVIALVIFLFFWLKKRKKERSPATGVTPLEVPEMRAPDLANSGQVTSHEFRSNEKGNRYPSGQLYPSHPTDSIPSSNPAASNAALLRPLPASPPASTLSYTSSQPPSESLSNENLSTAETRRVRELDAGPVPRHLQYEDNAETLPPEYGQVFSGRGLSRTADQLGQQQSRSPSSSLPTDSSTLTSTTTAKFALSQNPSSQPLQPVRRT